jgi:hypothetical protein
VAFDKGDFPTCIEELERATRINPSIVSVWFFMGSAAIRGGPSLLDIARHAFTRVVSIDPENGE